MGAEGGLVVLFALRPGEGFGRMHNDKLALSCALSCALRCALCLIFHGTHFCFSLSASRGRPCSDPGGLCLVTQVTGVSAGQFVRRFEWDYSKFAVRQRLPALVALIQGGVGKIEEEHRNLSMTYAEKNQAMQV